MKAFSFITSKNQIQIGIEYKSELYNFSLAWELYKQLKSGGKGPGLSFLQLMVETDFFHSDTFFQVFNTLQQIRSLDDLKLKEKPTFAPPIDRPQKILGIGRNYKEHAEELGNEIPKEPLFFCKSPSALIAHEQVIQLPENIGRVDFEGELAIVMGKPAHNISESYAMDFIAGYTILNDVTARDLQRKDIEAGHPWFRAKSFDTFCPVGPFLVPKEEIKNPESLEIEVRVNGERRQQASVSQMIFSIPEIVAYLSRFVTLHPGDIIATGTPKGVGALKSGDVVECEIKSLGVLKNFVQ